MVWWRSRGKSKAPAVVNRLPFLMSKKREAVQIHLWAVCLLTPASRATADTLSPARTSSTSLCRPRGASRELERWSKGPLSLQPSTSHSLEESSPFVTSCVNNLLAHNS